MLFNTWSFVCNKMGMGRRHCFLKIGSHISKEDNNLEKLKDFLLHILYTKPLFAESFLISQLVMLEIILK